MSTTSPRCLRSIARRILRTVATAGAVGLAACESSTAPQGALLNTAEALRDYQVLESVFASDGWAGFTALAGRTPLSGRAALGSVAALADITDGASSQRFAVNLFRAMNPQAAGAPAFAVGVAAVPLLSDSMRGRTMPYNAALGQYRINPTRTGAPSNGVRLVLYEVDANNVPIAGREIGSADLIDDGSAAAGEVALGLAVERGVTMLSYRTRVSQTAQPGTHCDGRLRNRRHESIALRHRSHRSEDRCRDGS